MKPFKFFWTTHKWTGIILAFFFVLTSVTGFMLLIKKNYDFIQPPTQRGVEGEVADFASLADVIDAVLAEDHPDFQSIDDVDRIDTRLDKRVHKVRSTHNYTEYQVDAVTAEILSGPSYRMSDWLESLHDGSFFGDIVHSWVMPVVALALLFLVFSGYWLWLEPVVRRAKRKKKQRAIGG